MDFIIEFLDVWRWVVTEDVIPWCWRGFLLWNCDIIKYFKEQKQKEPEQVYTPSIEPGIILNDQQPDLAKVDSKPEAIEEIWVRVDIDPIESPKPLSVAQLDATPTKKRKGLLGRLIKQVKQVVAGEELDWQQLKEGNRPLEDGIHQVANTYYRTEQTVKQTFQIQWEH